MELWTKTAQEFNENQAADKTAKPSLCMHSTNAEDI